MFSIAVQPCTELTFRLRLKVNVSDTGCFINAVCGVIIPLILDVLAIMLNQKVKKKITIFPQFQGLVSEYSEFEFLTESCTFKPAVFLC